YRKYLDRKPDRREVRRWARQVEDGNMTLPDVKVGILSSKEYYKHHGNDPRRFVRALFRDVLNRKPIRTEVNAWEKNLNDAGKDRNKLVRMFLKAAETELKNK